MAFTPTVANSLFDTGNTSVRQEIGTSAKELIRAIDPTFAEMFLSSMQNLPSEGNLGRDLRFHREYYGGLTGVIRGGNQNKSASLYGGATDSYGAKLFNQNTFAPFPRAQDGANPKPYGLTTKLYSCETNLMLTLTMLEMDALPANIKQHVTPVLRGFAKQIALWAATSFFADASSQYRLGTFSTDATTITVDESAYTVTFQPTERVTHKFAVGQPIDLWSDSTTRRNVKSGGTADSETDRVLGFVVDVNHWTNKVKLAFNGTQSVDGTSTSFATWIRAGGSAKTDGTNVVGWFVTYANTYGQSPTSGFGGLYSYMDWLKYADYGEATAANRRILGANAITDTDDDYIDVTQHGEFRSGYFNVNGPLTETQFLAHLVTANRALDPLGYYLDTLLAAEGIWLNIFDQQTAQRRVNTDRGGQVASLNAMGLAQGFSIACEGREYKGYTSRFMKRGQILGLRRSNNWALIVPPDGQGTTRNGIPDVPDRIPVNFIMPALTGTNSIRFPVLDADGRVTEACQMPAKIRMQWQPMEQIPMCLWDNVSDTFVASDASS